jgi:hypothetical protein
MPAPSLRDSLIERRKSRRPLEPAPPPSEESAKSAAGPLALYGPQADVDRPPIIRNVVRPGV